MRRRITRHAAAATVPITPAVGRGEATRGVSEGSGSRARGRFRARLILARQVTAASFSVATGVSGIRGDFRLWTGGLRREHTCMRTNRKRCRFFTALPGVARN